MRCAGSWDWTRFPKKAKKESKQARLVELTFVIHSREDLADCSTLNSMSYTISKVFLLTMFNLLYKTLRFLGGLPRLKNSISRRVGWFAIRHFPLAGEKL
jgi:hypothetical protein